eukprot:gene32933-42620_t
METEDDDRGYGSRTVSGVTLPFLRVFYCGSYKLSSVVSSLWKSSFSIDKAVIGEVRKDVGLFGQGYRHAAKRSYQMEEGDLTSLSQYAAGVNAYWAEIDFTLPHYFIATCNSISGWENQLLSHLLSPFHNAYQAIPDFKVAKNGHNSGGTSTTSRETHGGIEPELNGFKISGDTIPGIPYFWNGNNSFIGWCSSPSAGVETESLLVVPEDSDIKLRKEVVMSQKDSNPIPQEVFIRETGSGSPMIAAFIGPSPTSSRTETSCSNNPGTDILSTILEGGGRVTPSHVNSFLGDVYSPSGMRLAQWVTIAMDNNGHSGGSLLSPARFEDVSGILKTFQGQY